MILLHNARLILIFLFVYLLLTGNIRPGNLLLGLLLAAGLIWLTRPSPRPISHRNLLRMSWAFIRYVGLLLWDIALNAWWVTLVVFKKRPFNPGIIAIDSNCQTELGVALSAHAITASPGEMVVEIGDDGKMYTHCLDVTDKDKLMADAQALRRGLLNDIFD
jgi:multisubunit Na+/H+ antiporter MnhE subunit